MNPFKLLFGQQNPVSETSIWHGKDFTKSYPNIVANFFIPDRIAYDTFAMNEYANNNIDVYHEGKLNCTKSYSDFMMKHHRGESVPDWFYIAYPDVAKWMVSSGILDEAEFNRPPYIDRNGITLKFFRVLIDKFKAKGFKLECSK